MAKKKKDPIGLTDYLSAIANRDRYAGFFKGLPREDQQVEERHIAEILFPDAQSVESIQDPPDVRVTTRNRVIGVEVTELVDQKMVEQHMLRRAVEQKLGLTPKDAWDAEQSAFRAAQGASRAARENGDDPQEAFSKTYKANHPTPDHISPTAVAPWTPQTVAAELDRIIGDKDGKLEDHTAGYDEICLAIHTDEAMIDSHMLTEAKALRKYKPSHISRVVVVLSYRPWANGNNGYPVIEI